MTITMRRSIGAGLVAALLLLVSLGVAGSRGVEAQEPPAPGIQLQPGFTNIAYLGPTLPLPDALTNATDAVSAIWSFRAGADDSPWDLWSATLPAALQGFDTLTSGRAYFVVSDRDIFWEYGPGEIPPPQTTVDLQPGLNHIVYTGDTLPVEEALAGPAAAGLQTQQLRTQQSSALTCVRLIWVFTTNWSLWNPTLPPAVQGFTVLQTGFSYFVSATEPCTWTFPGTFSVDMPEPEPEPEPAPTLDFGDAPDSYGTTLAADGARHTATDGFFLGAAVDTESDGQPGATALDDDTNGVDDEDGVTPPPQLTLGATVTFRVTASADGFLDAWIDFDGDGAFDDPRDRVFTSEPLVAGENILSVTIPMDATAEIETYARLRFSSVGGLAPTGAAADGEVEDYRIPLVAPPPPDGGGGAPVGVVI